MAAPQVREIWQGRGGSAEAGGAGSEGTQRRYVRRFRVVADRWDLSPLEVMLLEGIPRITDPYMTGAVSDLAARCHAVTPENTDEPNVWEVTAEYSTAAADVGDPAKEGTQEPGQDGQGQQSDNPLSRPAEISWDSEHYSRVAERDLITSLPIANSAGDPFDPPVEVDDSRPTLTIVRNQAGFDPAIAIAYQDTVNADTFFGFGAGQAKCMRIIASSSFENNQFFWKVTYVFAFRREGWQVSVLDQGYFEIVGGQRKHIMTQDAVPIPVSQPVPLDGTGKKLAVAQIQAGAFHYRTFSAYRQMPFAALALP